MNKEFIKYVEQRLDEWATWYSSGNSYGLGFPRRSIEHILMTEGIVPTSTKPQLLPCNEDAEEIEALVVEMGKQNNKMAYILRHHYFEPGALRAKAVCFSEIHSKVSYNKFKVYVDMAKQWLAGRLSASQS